MHKWFIKKNASVLACVLFLFFLLFRSAFAKQLLEQWCQKRGSAPYKHFHRKKSFHTNLVVQYMRCFGKNVCPVAKTYPLAYYSSACSVFIAERKTTLSFSWVKELSTCSSGTHSTCAISPSRALMCFCWVCVRK